MEKWSNYAHSCISGTHGTHAVVPGRAPSLDSPSEKWNRTFAYYLKVYKFCLIGLLWFFRCRYLLKISNVIKRRNGSFEKLHWTSASRRLFLTSDLNKWVGGGGGTPDFKWRGWSKDLFGFEIFDSGIFSLTKVLIYVGIFWRIQNILKLPFCIMLLMKQKMFLGVSSVSWVFWGFVRNYGFFSGGGGEVWFLSTFEHPRNLKSGVPPSPWEQGATEGVVTFKITQLASAHGRQQT